MHLKIGTMLYLLSVKGSVSYNVFLPFFFFSGSEQQIFLLWVQLSNIFVTTLIMFIYLHYSRPEMLLHIVSTLLGVHITKVKRPVSKSPVIPPVLRIKGKREG